MSSPSSLLPPPQPFVKWAGGKRALLPHLLPCAGSGWDRYHEPFLGGGALFFALAAAGQRTGSWAELTDANLRLVRTWWAIQDGVEEVIARLHIHAEQHSEEHYYRVRSVDIDACKDDSEVAAWFVYLNRTGFNGLYRVNRKNAFNVPFGRYKDPAIVRAEHLRACSQALAGVHIRHGSYLDVLATAQPGDLVYFDPPYVPLSGTAHFTSYTRGGFGPEDQVNLRDAALQLRDRGVRVVLSNHDTPLVRELYAAFEVTPIQVGRSINSKTSARGKVGEVIIT